MIQELTAQGYIGVMRGGKTDPILVGASTNSGIESFVVKVFSTADIEKKNSMQNEVLGNFLAQEFGLSVPEPALIKLTPEFMETVPQEQLRRLQKMDRRIKFGTRLCENIQQYETELGSAFIQKKISPDTLFGFDTLIRNSDRTNRKSNLLISTNSDKAFVIDHELGFQSIDRAIHELKTNNWMMKYSQFHIFYSLLKRKKTATKSNYFNEFHEHLKHLNISKIDPYLQQLNAHSYHIRYDIKSWLTFAKANANNFVNILRGAIR